MISPRFPLEKPIEHLSRCSRLAPLLMVAAFFSSLEASSPAWSAYSHPVRWSDMNAIDLNGILKSQYASEVNLYAAQIDEAVYSRVLSDLDSRIRPEFKVPEQLQSKVKFWLKIYTLYSSKQVVLYDSTHPDIVYEVVGFDEIEKKARNRVVYEILAERKLKGRISALKIALESLQKNPNPRKPTADQKLVLQAHARYGFPRHRHSFREMKGSLRAQRGQRDNIVKGLLAAETFFPNMEAIFRGLDVPIELTRLPLVESSFNLSAHSKAGAMGIWQFMPKTGKEFMMVDDSRGVDERKSPLKSTVAAAKLLRRNYKMLGNWALAIISYNSGHGGLPKLSPQEEPEKAALQFSRIKHLFNACSRAGKTKRFGYASANYYAEFLAVLHAESYRNLFYGEPSKMLAHPVTFVPAPSGKSAFRFAMDSGVPLQLFKLYNPDIKNLNAALPRNFLLALPGDYDNLGTLISHKQPGKVPPPKSARL